MKYTNIIEKIACLFKLISTNMIYPIFLLVLFGLILIFILNKVLKRKKTIVLMIISYLALFLVIIINNYKSLSKVFDSIMTNFFTNIYFPSIYAYLFVLFTVDISMIVISLAKNGRKSYKISTGICFFVLQFLFAMIMQIVGENNISLFVKKSLFSNTNLVVLLELSINTFIVWLLSLFVIYTSSKIYDHVMDMSEVDMDLSADDVIDDNILGEEVSPDVVVSGDAANNLEHALSYIDNSQIDSNNTMMVDYDENINDMTINNEVVDTVINDEVATISDNVSNDSISSEYLFDKLLNNGLPLIKEEKEKENIGMVVDETTNDLKDYIKPKKEENSHKNSYTLNDYKIFNKILKEIRRTNSSNVINIDRTLEITLLMKYPEEEYNLFKDMVKNYSN